MTQRFGVCGVYCGQCSDGTGRVQFMVSARVGFRTTQMDINHGTDSLVLGISLNCLAWSKMQD